MTEQFTPRIDSSSDRIAAIDHLTIACLVAARLDAPERPSQEQQHVLGAVPTALNLSEMNQLSERVALHARSVLPDTSSNELETARTGRKVAIQTIEWFGHLSCVCHDLTSASSAAAQLRLMAGIAGRRAARSIRVHARQTQQSGSEYPVYGTSY